MSAAGELAGLHQVGHHRAARAAEERQQLVDQPAVRLVAREMTASNTLAFEIRFTMRSAFLDSRR
jgi:hypothetical protein